MKVLIFLLEAHGISPPFSLGAAALRFGGSGVEHGVFFQYIGSNLLFSGSKGGRWVSRGCGENMDNCNRTTIKKTKNNRVINFLFSFSGKLKFSACSVPSCRCSPLGTAVTQGLADGAPR